MSQKLLLILISGLWGTAAVALPCSTCPKQMLYLPTDQVALPPDTLKDSTKVKPSKKKEGLLAQAPSYAQDRYPANNAKDKTTLPNPKYSHRMRNLGLEETQSDHNRYVCDPRKMQTRGANLRGVTQNGKHGFSF